MRLSPQEQDVLKSTLNVLAPNAELYLFGSRTDDKKRGGDIDLLVVSDTLKKHDIRKLRMAFMAEFGEQKMDIVLDDGQFKDPFVQLIKPQLVRL